MFRQVGSERKVASSIKSLLNGRSLQLECPRVLHEGLVHFLIQENETVVEREKM